jgi:hypothetical protein
MELGCEGGNLGFKGRSGVLTAGVIVFFLAVFSVYSQNLVQNGNFSLDGGSFDDWTISHTLDNPENPNYSPMIAGTGNDGPNGDAYYARFLNEESGSGDILSQDIPTIPGDIYEVSFYAEDGAGHNSETEFSFGNFTDNLANTFATGPGQWLQGWTNFDFTLMASQTETLLSYMIWADTGSEFGVTGVTVTPVPAPDFDGLKVGNTFQVTVETPVSYSILIQATTNMVNWVNAFTNTAPFTFTDSCLAYPQRFYRAALVAQ